MSRICVKNLPRYLTEERLREHFAGRGEVTDAKIMKSSDGRSRQFGFVGYRTEEEAQAAVKFFNRSFIDTSRLSCELAQPVGDPNLRRPWSRHSEGSSTHRKAFEVQKQPLNTDQQPPPKGSTDKIGDDVSEDPQLLEFLHVMQPRSKSRLWADDIVEIKKEEDKKGISFNFENSSKEKSKKKIKQPQNESVERAESRASREKANGEGTRKISYEDEGVDDAAVSDETLSEGGVIDNDVPFAKVDDCVGDETISDVDYLKKRINPNWSDDQEDTELFDSENESHLEEDADLVGLTEQSDEEGAAIENKSADLVTVDGKTHAEDSSFPLNLNAKEVSAEQQESVAETGRLFVRNLSYTTSEEDLEHLFGQFGELSQVHLVLDKETKRSKGFAYILFMLPECAVRAMEALDRSTFQGRLIHILPAKRPPPLREKDWETTAKVPGRNQFKQDREGQKRALEASGNTQAWNSLFIRSDTVAENVARKYGLSKSDFLDPEAEDLAVRLALGETQVIAETKKALDDGGVSVEVLEELASGKLDGVKRSNHIILVKNLPFMTTEADLVAMFGKFGSLERVILPPTKTLSLVVYLEASEARLAFKGLAYKRFKHVPLYLEWAPENIFVGKGSKDLGVMGGRPTIAIGQDQVKRVVLEHQLTGLTHADTELDSTESSSVFVKNLNFKTTESMLKNHFKQNMKEGSVRSVKIKTKLGKSGKPLSMGFGFVEFDTSETAKTVCNLLQGTVLEGHALILQLSHGKERTGAEMVPPSEKPNNRKSSTKLIVRNVAFEATKKDLRQLFNPFGQIKSLRLPKKFDGNHRGFAFLEFSTKQEAENAYSALASTHLYGRHLVLERAKEDESLEELRARTATQFCEEVDPFGGSVRPSKKRKHSVLDADMRFGQIVQ